jgi:hypothetical protein
MATLSQAEQEIISTVREFVDREVVQVVRELDQAMCIPRNSSNR